MAIDGTKEILDEIKALRKEMEQRMDSFESRLESMAGIVDETANPQDNEPTDLSETPASAGDPVVVEADVPAEVPINAIPAPADQAEEPAVSAEATEVEAGDAAAEPEQEPVDVDSSIGAEAVDVVLTPLLDISLARAVVSALNESEGVKRAALREVRADAAVIDTAVDAGVSVVAVLRSRLPVSFKVADSDNRSVTIALAQPANGASEDSDGSEDS